MSSISTDSGFRDPQVIDQVIAQGKIFAHAGRFSITDPLLNAHIERLEGTADSIIGLPKALTQRLLRAAMNTRASEDSGSTVQGGPPEGGTS